MLIITAIVQDNEQRTIKVRINGVNREAAEIWNILFSRADTAVVICDGRQVEVVAENRPDIGKVLRTPGGSRTLACPMEEQPAAPMQMLVFGDSIAWGAGLRPVDKFSTLVGERLRSNNRNASLTIKNFANSGAIIGPASEAQNPSGFTVDLDSVGENKIGEVPNRTTSVHKQIDAFQASGVDPATIDFILLSAGINDVGIRENIVSYLDHTSAITDFLTTGKFVQRMPALLNRMLDVFSNARIIVTSYYPVVTASSKPKSPPEMALAIAYLTGGNLLTTVPFRDEARTNIIANCATFATTHLASLTNVVNDINAATPAGFGPRLFIASPSFLPNHALFGRGDMTQLWKPNFAGLSNDDKHRARRPLCDQAFPGTNADNRNCMGAAVGHPNRKGARAYLRAIVPLL